MLVGSGAGAGEVPKKHVSSSGGNPLQVITAIGFGIGWSAFNGDVVACGSKSWYTETIATMVDYTCHAFSEGGLY